MSAAILLPGMPVVCADSGPLATQRSSAVSSMADRFSGGTKGDPSDAELLEFIDSESVGASSESAELKSPAPIFGPSPAILGTVLARELSGSFPQEFSPHA